VTRSGHARGVGAAVDDDAGTFGDVDDDDGAAGARRERPGSRARCI
jgi:hypothetical protein